jgi:hypothetical protein
MKKVNNSLSSTATFVLLFLALICWARPAEAQSSGASSGACSVEISSLNEGDKVGPSVTVKGLATTPTDGYLWILARKKSMGNQWWPQAGGAVEIGEGGRWEAEVFFGRPADVGSTFEVAAVVVNRQTDERLIKWVATAKELDYPPVAFPNSVSNCRVVTVKVVKER